MHVLSLCTQLFFIVQICIKMEIVYTTIIWIWRYQREVIKIRKSKDRQHNGEKKKYKIRNKDLQNILIKLKIK